MRYYYYKEIKQTDFFCDNCHKELANYELVRIVVPGEYSLVAGHNMSPNYFCSLDCLKEFFLLEGENDYTLVKVKKNTVRGINKKGYSA